MKSENRRLIYTQEVPLSGRSAAVFKAVAESFFASIKKEVFRKYFYTTKKAVIKAVEEYVEFYNDYRPHQRLGYLTPNKVEDEYYSQNKTMATSD